MPELEVVFIGVIKSISGQKFQIGSKSGQFPHWFFYIILNSFWSRVKSGLVTSRVNIGSSDVF